MSRLRAAVDAVRNPAYTGERRCLPCTALNLAAVAALAVAAAVALTPLAALPVAAAGAAAVWLRGYVVPGTPRFAPRLAAALPGAEAVFGHGGRPSAAGDSLAGDAALDGEALLERLVAAGVLRADADRVVPAEAFVEEWRAEMAVLRDLPTPALADAVGEVADAASVRPVVEPDGEWVALGDGSGSIAAETWLARPVAVAEAGAARALVGRVDDATRLAAAGALRAFLGRCPDCGAELAETTTAACCGGYTSPQSVPDEVLACPDCDVALHTFEA